MGGTESGGEDQAQRSQGIGKEIDAAYYRWLTGSAGFNAPAELRLLLDGAMLSEDDPLVAEGLDSFQRRCLGKLSKLEG